VVCALPRRWLHRGEVHLEQPDDELLVRRIVDVDLDTHMAERVDGRDVHLSVRAAEVRDADAAPGRPRPGGSTGAAVRSPVLLAHGVASIPWGVLPRGTSGQAAGSVQPTDPSISYSAPSSERASMGSLTGLRSPHARTCPPASPPPAPPPPVPIPRARP